MLYEDMQIFSVGAKKEVDYFRALIKALNVIGYSEEMHGRKFPVFFKDPFLDPLKTQCELCDILIIIYSGFNLRFTFMQNKSEVFSKSIYLPNNKVNLPIRQQYVLGYFPDIYSGNSKFTIPRHILSSHLLDSIGSLGVFYKNSIGDIDMDYSIMSLMVSTSKYGVADFQTNAQKVHNCYAQVDRVRNVFGYNEVEAVSNLFDFEKSLIYMEIGEPIDAVPKEISEYILSLAIMLLEQSKNNDNETAKIYSSDLRNIMKERNLQFDEKAHGEQSFFNGIAIVKSKGN